MTKQHRWRNPQRDTFPGLAYSDGSILRGGHGGNDRAEVGGLEARAADQRAPDIRDCEDLAGVRRLHRAAIQNADSPPVGAEPRPEALPEMAVHRRYIVKSR